MLTEKIARRGLHLTREYSVDPLEALFVEEVMDLDFTAIASEQPLGELREGAIESRQPLYPVLDSRARLLGVLTRGALLRAGASAPPARAGGALVETPLTVRPHDTLRAVAQRFAEHSVGCAPVVEPSEPDCVLGLITVEHLLHARLRDAHEEHRRERILAAWPRRIRDGSPAERAA